MEQAHYGMESPKASASGEVLAALICWSHAVREWDRPSVDLRRLTGWWVLIPAYDSNKGPDT